MDLFDYSLGMRIEVPLCGGKAAFSRRCGFIYADISCIRGGGDCVQLCRHGRLTGVALEYLGDDADEFTRICRRWLKDYVKDNKDALQGT